MPVVLCQGCAKKGPFMMTKEKLLTFRDVQEILLISQTTLLRLVAEKKIGAYKVGQQWRFSEDHVRDYLERNQQTAVDDAD